jgi:hypothetical protein
MNPDAWARLSDSTFADVLGRWSGITVKQAKQLIE